MAAAVLSPNQNSIRPVVQAPPNQTPLLGRYVIVTPARNEADFIELTLKSVVAQSVLPLKWVIVSDGSTDRTDDIVRQYAQRYPWIELLRMPERTSRDFAGKVGCFNRGFERVKDLPFEVVASLDADISFDPEYFEFLLGKFKADPKLGLAGTPFSEAGAIYNYKFASTEHVSGACQVFRRTCFEQIGGYVPLKGGGIDVVAVLSSRAKGWRTQTFTEKVCVHHRPMGTGANKSRILADFRLGQRNYRLGFHPLWQTLRSFYQMSRKPYIVGGLALWTGYMSALISRMEIPISRELVAFQRQDQMRRLAALLRLK